MTDRAARLKGMEAALLEGAPPSSCKEWESFLHSVVSDYDVAKNIQYALETGHPVFNEQLPENDRIVSICGSAPSLNETHKDLTGDIWACNDAGWKLLDEGIVPKYWMLWDPQPPESKGSPLYCLRKLHKDTTYLIASMCDPAIFDKLKDYNVLIWHPWFGDAIPLEDWLRGWEQPVPEYVGFGLKVPGLKLGPNEGAGTSAAVTRSMQFAPLMGYRHLHIHGCDSSSRSGVVHFTDLEVDHDQLQKVCWLGVKSIPGSRRPFVTTPQMERQIMEFEPLVVALRDAGVKVTVHGTGAIPYLAMLKGWHVNDLPKT